jgi:hypothetical protein
MIFLSCLRKEFNFLNTIEWKIFRKRRSINLQKIENMRKEIFEKMFIHKKKISESN